MRLEPARRLEPALRPESRLQPEPRLQPESRRRPQSSRSLRAILRTGRGGLGAFLAPAFPDRQFDYRHHDHDHHHDYDRRQHRRRRVALGLCLALIAAPCLHGLHAQTPPSAPPPGVLVDVGGHKLHIRCVGPEGRGPTVILEAGGGGFSTSWTQVQERLAPRVRSCAYDRAGLGWSEPGPSPRTMRQEAFELHALLKAAKVRGPVVIAGHSIGGLLARLYTAAHRRDVAGLVLVDATHESAVLGNVRLGGMVRLREHATPRPIPKPRRTGPVSTQYNPADDYMAEEFQQIYLSRQAKPDLLGDRPLIVLSAGKRSAPPGLTPERWAELKAEKEAQARDLTGLSRNARFILDPSSGHAMQNDNPQLVAQAIEDVVAAAAAHARLTP